MPAYIYGWSAAVFNQHDELICAVKLEGDYDYHQLLDHMSKFPVMQRAMDNWRNRIVITRLASVIPQTRRENRTEHTTTPLTSS